MALDLNFAPKIMGSYYRDRSWVIDFHRGPFSFRRSPAETGRTGVESRRRLLGLEHRDNVGFCGGFFTTLRKLLIKTEDLESADLIFVLAGHRNRKVYGAQMFRAGWAPAVLMSSTNPSYIARVIESVAGSSSRLEAIVWGQVRDAAVKPAPAKGHFFVFLDSRGWVVEAIPVGLLGTFREIKALGQWLRRHPDMRRILVVSAAMHLKRVGMCCRRLLPQGCEVRLIAVPADDPELSSAAGKPREGTRQILREWLKVLWYGAVLMLFRRPAAGE